MLDTKNNLRKNIISILIIIFLSLIVCMLIYKSQVEWGSDARIKYTLMSAHKDNSEVVLSKDNPVVYQDFICNVPNLKKIQIEGIVDGSLDKSNLLVEVIGLDTGKTYCKKQGLVSSFYNSKAKKKVYKLKKMPADTEGMLLRVIVTLETETDGKIILTANSKPGTVLSFDGNADDHTNIIYRMRYGYVSELSGIYRFICIWLVSSLLIIYYLVIIRRWNCEKWFPVVALLLGLAVQWVIPVYGVPDEPWHMDTAYQLSNTIMRVDKEPQEGTVLKRECDIVTSDLLANDVESNSYYQLINNTFTKPDNTNLRRVGYVDAGLQVPGFVYLPAALGITIGRLAGMSGMMMYQLARIISLLVYIMLVWLAVKIMPFCNTVTAMAGISLIALQQGASASYDAMINGIIFLFISACLNIAYGKETSDKRKYVIIIILTAIITAFVKGGAYIPVILLILSIFRKKMNGKRIKDYLKKIILAAIVLVACAGLALWKYYPFLSQLLGSDIAQGMVRYTPAYVLKHPLEILYMCWCTFMKYGDKYIAGLFGGILGWHNIEIQWAYIIPVIMCMYLLIHVENERPPKHATYRIMSVVISVFTLLLVVMAMLITCTDMGSRVILGIQGRYFIPVEVIFLSAFSTPMITVAKRRADHIIMAVICLEMLMMLQALVMFI